MKTYILIMQPNREGQTYFKVGKTENLDRRLRMYQLHNPAITDILIIDGDIEEDILFDYRWQRIQNKSGRDSEWVVIDYEYIAEELIERYNFQNYQRRLKGQETIKSRMIAYQKYQYLDMSQFE